MMQLVAMRRMILLLVVLAATSNNSHAFVVSPQISPRGIAARSVSSKKPVSPTTIVSPTTTGTVSPSLLHLQPSIAALWQAFVQPANLPVAVGLNFVGFSLLRSNLMKKLTTQGYYHSMALGMGVWASLGWKGWTLAVAYLFLGSKVTKVKFAEKEEKGIAEARGGRRGPENVWGSAATGLLCALAAALAVTPVTKSAAALGGISADLWILGFVASFATKLSDTFASEIGKAYGKTTFLITTLERVEPGTEGAVSAEGTAASVVGATILSLYGWAIGLITAKAVPLSIVAAFVATNIESLLGATLQGKKNLEWITNELVNFINTTIGATLAIAAGRFLL